MGLTRNAAAKLVWVLGDEVIVDSILERPQYDDGPRALYWAMSKNNRSSNRNKQQGIMEAITAAITAAITSEQQQQ